MAAIMKIPFISFLLILLPFFSLAAEDDGDWEFLKSRLPNRIATGAPMVDQDITDSFRFVPSALKFIEEAEMITVFEGMPHQNFESELLKSERDKIEESMIGGFPFYPQSQIFREKDEPRLREILLLPGSFRPFLYLKMCGGFHPDYVIRFTKGDEHCDLLLCFGCGDARILHSGKVIHSHIFKKAWQETLAVYAKHRPQPKK